MLRVQLLGELRIEVDGEPVEPPTSRRARALLGWLAVDRGMQARSRLAARFWPDVLDESARTSLRSALSALRRALGEGSERYLIAGRDDVGLAGEELVWTDIAEFDRCVREGRLEEALELCRGELLVDLADDWVFERRDEHRDRVADVLARLAAGGERDGDLAAAIAYTRRQAALDPLAEEPQRDLMRRLAASGDRAAAIRTYDRLSQRLRDELRIAPSRATREVAEALREGADGVPAHEPAQKPEPAITVTPRPSEAPDPVAAGAAEPSKSPEPGPSVVTLLFTDLVGSTELLEELGDDEAERFRRVHFGLLRDVAVAHSGEEVKNLGDGLMVAFASAVNALGCAVGIQQAVHRHNARQGDERLKVRVGLNVGEPIRGENDYFGTPVVVAKRLCDKADGGQILASELLRLLVGTRGGFEFRPCGPIALKGIAEPLPTVEIGWEPAEERRLPLPAPLLLEQRAAPLVGRGTQFEELNRSWEEARAGDRRIVMLAGDPGIGKTRLAAEFCRRAHADGAPVLLGRCYEESLLPYQSFVEALRQYVAETPIDELRLQVGPHREALARLVPELSDPATPATLAADAGGSEREQFLLFDAVASLLGAIAEERPLILMLDDLHWADGPTLLLLRHVARATEHAPLLILGTYRETEVAESHPLSEALAEMRRARALDSLSLVGLAEEDVAALISSHSGRAAPTSVARSIVERTEGNPFFVEEVLRDVVADDDGSEALRVGVPQSVQDLLLRRMRRLDDTCRRLLPFAAVAGREFTLGVLERVCEISGVEVAESLEQAIAARIVTESAGSIGRYSFAHALIRETLYEQLSLTRRAQLHSKIGEAIESESGDRTEEQASTLAYHFSAAGNAAKAYQYHSLAAAAAGRVYAVEPALAHYTAAIEAGDELGLDPDREPALRRLLLQRGRMRLRGASDREGAAADYERALGSARRSEDREVEMEALNELGIVQLGWDVAAAASLHEAALAIAQELGDAVAQTNALNRLAVISSNLLEFSRGLELGERALELARPTGDSNVIGRAIDGIKLAVWQLGDLHRLEELTAELEPIWRQRGEFWYLQFTLLESAFVPIGAARWEEAAERLEEAAAINRRARDPAAGVLILDAFCWLDRSRGAYEEALSAGRQAMARGAATGIWEGWAAATLGWALLDLGAVDDAAEILERGLASAERIRSANQTTRCVSQLAWARSLQGDAEQASTLAERAAEMLERVSTPPGRAFLFGAHAYTALARVYLDRGEPERGEALLLPVLRAAERSGWLEAAAVSELVVGLCLEARGELERAGTTLARAAEVSDQSGIPAPSWEAHAALARILRAAGHPEEADEHAASAAATVDRVSAGLNDEPLRVRLRDRLSR